MKKYIFITPEGSTFSPDGTEIENIQVIGIVENTANEEDALKKLLVENDWIISANFNVEDFVCHEII